jgi:lysyl-tRNA synthetase, class II
MNVPQFIEAFGSMDAGTQSPEKIVAVAGRVWSKRESGAKLVFYDLHNEGDKLQVMADARTHSDGSFEEVHSQIRRGDIIGIVGFPGPPPLFFANL